MLQATQHHQPGVRAGDVHRVRDGSVTMDARSLANFGEVTGVGRPGVLTDSGDVALHVRRQPSPPIELSVLPVRQGEHRPTPVTATLPVGHPERTDIVVRSGPSLVYKSYKLFFIYASPLVQ